MYQAKDYVNQMGPSPLPWEVRFNALIHGFDNFDLQPVLTGFPYQMPISMSQERLLRKLSFGLR